ncbi:hypothetical protein R3P38DRAFT_2768955 [Favolaschia claudopus]|uniref:Uncharacterized protein n=1 Tax=Favolaschia claudopus TaxID=2862362 RepID=A0AAW0CNE4_9AGAR
MKRIHDPDRLLQVPPVPETSLKLHHAPAGMLALDPVVASSTFPSASPLEAPTSSASLSRGTIPRASDTAFPSISDSGLSSQTPASTIAATEFVAGSSRDGGAGNSIEPITAQSDEPLSHGETLNRLAKRKVDETLQQSAPPPKRLRQSRTCRKCAVEDCPGRKQVEYCVNRCRDCDDPFRIITLEIPGRGNRDIIGDSNAAAVNAASVANSQKRCIHSSGGGVVNGYGAVVQAQWAGYSSTG